MPPLQHLGSTYHSHPGTGWVNQTMKLLHGNLQAKSPQQTVELDGINSSAFHERQHIGGWTGAALASTATARDRGLPHASLFPSLAVRHLAAAAKSNSSSLNGEEGRVMVVQNRNLQLKHSEQIVIKSV